MALSFRNNKLAKVLNSERELVRSYGGDNGRRIGLRLQNIRDAGTLEELSKVPQTRVHELTGNRNEQISVDAKHPYRLILVCNHDQTPSITLLSGIRENIIELSPATMAEADPSQQPRPHPLQCLFPRHTRSFF